jgi:cytochrome b561
MTRKIEGYTAPARWLHWSVAILILAMMPVGFLMVQQGLGRTLQNNLYLFHKNVGVLVLILVLIRVVYRLRQKPPQLPRSIPLWQKRVSAWSHGILYGLILMMPVSGYIRVRAGGFPIESLDALGIGTWLPRSQELANAAKTVHYAGAIALVILLALHIGAALHHGLVKKDGVFDRMWPKRS